MKRTLLILIILIATSGFIGAQNRGWFEAEQFKYWPDKKNTFWRNHTEREYVRFDSIIWHSMQNNEPSIRDNTEWYEPDTIVISGYSWKRQFIYSYNEKGFKDTVTYRNIDNVSPELCTTSRLIYVYNADNRILSITGQLLSKNGTWINYGRDSFTYDFNGNQTSFLAQYWEGQYWGNDYQKISVYDNRSNLLLQYEQLWNWNNMEWDYYGNRYTGVYDEHNNKRSEQFQRWDGHDWGNTIQYTYTYNEYNYNDTRLCQEWNGAYNIWVNIDIFMYTYDNQGNMLSSFSRKWEEDIWRNYQVSTFTYDEYNNMLSWTIALYYWDTIWLDEPRNEHQYNYTYDSNNNMLSKSWLLFDRINNTWKNHERSLYDYDENSYLLSSIFQYGSGDAWTNRDRGINEYDNEYNKLSFLYQVWENNAWQDARLHKYKYDEHGNCLSGYGWKWQDEAWKTDYLFNEIITYNHGQSIIEERYPCRNVSVSYIKTVKPIVAIESEEKEIVDITVYPNPTSRQFIITNYELEITNVEIFDLLGRKLMGQKAEGSKQQEIDISHLPAGMYFMQIKTEKGIVAKKIVKK